MVNRLYENEACAVDIATREHWHFCRELLRRALEGWRDPWVAAHYYTYGLHPVKYRAALAQRQSRQRFELLRPPMCTAVSTPQESPGTPAAPVQLLLFPRAASEPQHPPHSQERAA